MSKRLISLVTIVASAVLAAALTAAPASAAPSSTQSQIDAVIAKHGGQQVSANQVAWNGGAVVLDIGTVGVGLAAVEGCADNAYCFYQNQNFGGRKLTFRDCTAAGLRQNLNDYGFHNQTTSWVVNKSLRLVDVFHGTNTRLWQARANSRSSNVGPDDNDKADWFRCYL